MIGYIKCHKVGNKAMLFKVSDEKLLKKYIKIWKKVSSLIDIKFGSEPVYGNNHESIKTKIESYGNQINTNFQVKKYQKKNASCKCLSLIMLDSVVKVNKEYYHQTLLEECKYENMK